jgi:hypothetical protein
MKNSSPDDTLDLIFYIAKIAMIWAVVCVIWVFVLRFIFIIVDIGPIALFLLGVLIAVSIQVARAVLRARRQRRDKLN